jgi:hypothetical protein
MKRDEKIEEMMKSFNLYIQKNMERGIHMISPNAQTFLEQSLRDFIQTEYAYDLED